MDGAGEEGTHEEAGHEPISQGQTQDAVLGGEGKHDVQERYEAGRFHCGPADFAGDVERRFGGGFTHGIVVYEPLKESRLKRALVSCGL